MDIEYIRQAGIFNPDEHFTDITIVGAGAIGSMTALTLSKMGLRDITVYDDDRVEPHNIPNQFYPTIAINKDKVSALHEVISDFAGINIREKHERINHSTELNSDIVIASTDNMMSREISFRNAKKYFIDARMGGEVMRIYTINKKNPKEVRYYKKTLYSDEEAEDLPCTERSIIYNISVIAGIIGNQVKRVVKGEPYYNGIIMDLTNMHIVKQGV